MPKVNSKKGASSAQAPYARPAKNAAANNIFKMNTDLGQHILKNPGVAKAIVDKAGLRQSDVVLEGNKRPFYHDTWDILMPFQLVLVRVI